MDAQDRQGLLEILDDRYAETATIISAQLPICEWHAAIGDPVVGGAILDRMVSAVIKIITKRYRMPGLEEVLRALELVDPEVKTPLEVLPSDSEPMSPSSSESPTQLGVV